ncbi:MAG: hypothetical protein ACYSX0_13385 [Planctomycetota bacterium]
MLRYGVAIVAVIIAAVVLWNVLVTTDRERVEADVLRLVELAKKGGQEAADEIYEALAEDYRGSGYFERERVRRELTKRVGAGRLKSLEVNDFDVVATGEEMEIPWLILFTEYGNAHLRVTYAKRNDQWKIVNVNRWKMQR